MPTESTVVRWAVAMVDSTPLPPSRPAGLAGSPARRVKGGRKTWRVGPTWQGHFVHLLGLKNKKWEWKEEKWWKKCKIPHFNRIHTHLVKYLKAYELRIIFWKAYEFNVKYQNFFRPSHRSALVEAGGEVHMGRGLLVEGRQMYGRSISRFPFGITRFAAGGVGGFRVWCGRTTKEPGDGYDTKTCLPCFLVVEINISKPVCFRIIHGLSKKI